tara:strand:- start:983 stop:1969 length:987 start_codon:yes stop_codon:yes gene_type:complete
MILKFFELKKINLSINKIILFYGKNEGLKKQEINNLIKGKKEVFYYEEKDILENKNNFTQSIFTKSLFEDEKIIIIKRATDKIFSLIEGISLSNLDDILIIIDSDNLEKKSKLRSFFEKSKSNICTAFYPDNEKTLNELTYDFLKKKNISISPSNINLIISRCNNDRNYLFNELNKIEFFSKGKKKLDSDNIIKITNLVENHSISDLIDQCLARNKKKTIWILNENNFSNEDCVMIARIFLNKLKRNLILRENFEKTKNIELTISSAKPPIFWKDKEIVKQQIYNWNTKNIKKLIYKLNELEHLIKKNFNNSINIISDFILEQSNQKY